MELTAAGVPAAEQQAGSPTRSLFATSLLIVLLLAPVFVSPELASVVALVVLLGWIGLNGLRIPRGWGHAVAPLLLVLLVGCLAAEPSLTRDLVRDVWYLGKSILLFGTGYVLAWYAGGAQDVLRAFTIAGAATAWAHLDRFLITPELLGESLGEIRHEAGFGFLITVIALAALSGCRRRGIRLFRRRWIAPLIASLCAVSLILSFSRTFFVALLIMVFVSYGGLQLFRPSAWTVPVVRRAIAVAVGASLLGAAGFVVASRTESGSKFIEKLMRSADEVAVRDYDQRRDIAMNWRGYQAWRAWDDWRNEPPLRRIIGRGYGTVIDMGVRSGQSQMRYVPTLHNGYLYTLRKTGLIGLTAYLAFFALMIRTGWRMTRRPSDDQQIVGELLVGAAVVILATTVTVAGLMNKVSMNPGILLIGTTFALGYKYRLEQEPPAAG